jgi:FG-GAP-like repeat/Bacterial Ig-like domain (group 3)/FG-GAP repeat
MRIHRLLLLCGLAAASLAVRAGTRTLQVPTRFDIGNTTTLGSIFTGDFTADGKPDVLVADQMQSNELKLRVAPGLGNGAFGSAIVTSVTGFRPEGIAHFNGDTSPDLYLAGPTGKIAVMLGAANGTFGAPFEVTSSIPADDVIAGDFTGDGKTDLALLSRDYHQLVVFAGDGSGGFPTSSSFAVPGYSVHDMAAGDFDHDGRLDVACNSYIVWNTGSSFIAEVVNDGGGGDKVAAGDVNGDGTTDLIVTTNRPWIYYGKPTRGLTAETVAGVGGPTEIGLLVTAMDDDGRADLVLGVGATGVTIASHNGTAFRAPRSFGLGEPAGALASADFDGDGNTDLAGLAVPTEGSFWTVRGKGNRTLDADVAVDLYSQIGVGGWGSFISDVNGDSKLDIVAVTNFENDLAVLFGAADGTFSAPVLTELPDSSYGSMHDAGDLNGDGKIDVVLWEPAGDEAKLSVFFSQTNGTFAAGPVQFTEKIIGNHIRLLPIADYTGDGKRDILDETGLLLPGLGNGAFGAPIATGIETWPYDSAVANVNGDALPDLLVRAGNDLRVYLNTGAGTFATPIAGPWGNGLSASDLNGDGLDDLIADGIYLGAGDGTFVNGPLQLSVFSAHGADFDGDGKMDLGNSGAIYFGTGTGTFDHAAQPSAMGQTLSTGDYDGNGVADLWTGQDWIIITRTGIAAAPAAASQLELTTPVNPIGFGSVNRIFAKPVSGTIRPRGAVFFSKPPAAPYAMTLVGADGTAWDYFMAPAMDSPVTYAAAFTGDSFLLSASSPTLTITSKRGTTNTTISTSKLTYDIGQSVVIGAGPHGGSVPPTGTVTVKKGTEVIKTLAAPGGTFSINDPSIFPLGTHELSAEYEGDGNYLPSVSIKRTITIKKVTPVMTLAMSPGPYSVNQQVTLTATFPNHADASGSVTFQCLGQTLGTAVISSATAVLSGPISWGEGYCVANYGGSEKYGVASAISSSFISYYGTMSTPPRVNVSATTLGGTQAYVSISPISGATHYDIYRSLDGAPLIHIFTTHSTTYNVGLPSETKVAVFAAAAKNTDTGAITAVGPRDFASFVNFTDDPAVASTTNVKAIHITELQNAINALRVAAGLTATTFSSPNGVISAAQLTSLRTAITQARAAFGMATTLTDPTITPGVTPIRAVHLQELRNSVR